MKLQNISKASNLAYQREQLVSVLNKAKENDIFSIYFYSITFSESSFTKQGLQAIKQAVLNDLELQIQVIDKQLEELGVEIE